ncbi:MAG: chloride channel protein [Acidobacteriota bacterium]|nr:chloride channel protein [Acidobacteriota bacterium]
MVGGLALRESNLFLLLSILIGLASGLLVVCFRIAIEWTHVSLFGSSLKASPWRLLSVPTLAGLVIATCVIFFFQGVRGSGVNQTKAAVYIYDGYIPFRTVIGKFLLSALAIGSGQSLGPEDPSLQIGAGIASSLGRRLHLSREKIRLMAPVGAAAGLAAAFNAPISAIIFVIEEIIGLRSASVIGGIILAAVSSVAVMRAFLGSEPLFRIPAYHLANSTEFLAYAVLGVVGGFSSLIFVKLVGYLRPRLKALPRWTQYLQPGLAGLAVGVIGLRFPQVMGAGYYYIDQAMHGQYIWQILVFLAAFKILATTISFVSGTPGGMFAPTLFVGAMIGGAVGGVEHHFFPALTGPVGAYALVGMGTLFAGFIRAPMTSVFMVLEVSGNYSIILPVLVSNTIAYLISRKYQSVSLFDMLTRQDGVDLPSMEEQREETSLRVEDAMRPLSGPLLRGSDTAAQALAEMGPEKRPGFLLVQLKGKKTPEQGWFAISNESLHRRLVEGNGSLPLRNFEDIQSLPWVHPDQTLDVALRLIGNHPFLPVLSRADATRLEGIISLDDILSAYRRAFVNSPLRPDPY